jgi:aminomethyltransferase
MLKHTSLYTLHSELNAKMVEFAGYQMPLFYAKGILHEHRHCRSQAGFFDISHMGQGLMVGETAPIALERLVPSRISRLPVGKQKYTVLTNAHGGVIDDIMVTRLAGGLMLVVNAACKEKVFTYLNDTLKNTCEIKTLDDKSLFALQGPLVAALMQKWSPAAAQLTFLQTCSTHINGIACHISRSGYTGEDGFEISLANHDADALARFLLAEPGVEPIGLGARDTLRLEAGLCLYGHELTEAITPVEAGLRGLIDKNHEFPGADKILLQLQEDTETRRVGLSVKSKIPLRAGHLMTDANNQVVGQVTSGGFSPSLGKPIAMAQVNRHHASLGNTLYAQVRDEQIAVTVTRLPFIPHRYLRSMVTY